MNKEKKIPGTFNIFDVSEAVRTIVETDFEGDNTHMAYSIGWKERSHVPLYNLCPITTIHGNSFLKDAMGKNVQKYINNICGRNLTVKNLLCKLYNEKMFMHFFMAATQLSTRLKQIISGEGALEYVDHAISILTGSSLYPSYVPIYPGVRIEANGSTPLITAMKTGIAVSSKMKSKVHHKDEELGNPVYFGAFYFLYMRNSMDGSLSSNSHNWHGSNGASKYEETCDFKPLMVLVTSSTNAKIVGAAAKLGGLVDPSLLELWVDPSLESVDVAHPIRTQYVRMIRNPLVKAGVKLVIKDLSNSFVTIAPPKFKTIKAEKEWIEKETEMMLSSYAKKVNITRPTIQHQISQVKEVSTPGGFIVEQYPF